MTAVVAADAKNTYTNASLSTSDVMEHITRVSEDCFKVSIVFAITSFFRCFPNLQV